MLFQPNARTFGQTYSEWIVKWWRWLLSIPPELNPGLDQNGMHASENQIDPHVWFLAGTFGGSVVRTCKIPYGRAIFMPVINYHCSFADYPHIRTETELRPLCEKEIDDIKNISFMVDDLPLSNLMAYRASSPLFAIELKDNNVLNVAKCNTQMISDGYWVFLKPLEIGPHQLISWGSCRSGRIIIGSTYNVYVE